MYETTYHRPASVAEAVSLFSNASDGRFLAGGQTLIPTMKQRLAAPSDVIDVGKIAEMRGIEVEAQDELVETAVVGDPVGFLLLRQA